MVMLVVALLAMPIMENVVAASDSRGTHVMAIAVGVESKSEGTTLSVKNVLLQTCGPMALPQVHHHSPISFIHSS